MCSCTYGLIGSLSPFQEVAPAISYLSAWQVPLVPTSASETLLAQLSICRHMLIMCDPSPYS